MLDMPELSGRRIPVTRTGPVLPTRSANHVSRLALTSSRSVVEVTMSFFTSSAVTS